MLAVTHSFSGQLGNTRRLHSAQEVQVRCYSLEALGPFGGLGMPKLFLWILNLTNHFHQANFLRVPTVSTSERPQPIARSAG
jgi:hypothetical protein